MNLEKDNQLRLLMMLLTLATTIPQTATAVSVGTAPGVLDLGEVRPGKDYSFYFYLTTNAKTDVLVGLSYIPVHADIYTKNTTGRYTFIPAEASQENIERWVEIPTKSMLLSPNKVKVVNLEGGGVVKAHGTVNVILHVPQNAEPGYHAGAITISPTIPTTGSSGTGVVTFGVTRFIFVFRVTGTAVRKGEIMTLIGQRVDERRAKVNVVFKNTGTCTIQASVGYVKLYDKFGNLTAELRPLNTEYVKPGEIATLTADWYGDVKPGTYRAQARVDYLTGYATFEDRVDIPAKITVEKREQPSVMSEGFPWLTILLILIIIALAYYYFKD